MRCLKPGGETPVTRGFADDQSSEASRSRRWHKTREPNPKLQAGIDARVSHTWATQNVMLFPVRFGLLFRQRNVKYLLGSRRKVFEFFLSGTAKTDGPLVAGSGPNRDSIRTLPRFRKAHPTPAPSSRVISSCIAASNFGRSRQREALSSLWARAAELAHQHGLYSNGMNSASGLLPA